MNHLPFVFLALFACLSSGMLMLSAAAPAIETENDVLVLTEGNFDNAVKEHDILLVQFYAPWCGFCKGLEPEYAKAAAELQKLDPPLYLAKVDATEHKNLAIKYEIQGFPTMKLFRRGAVLDYGGARNTKAIMEYMIRKSGPPVTTLKTLADAEAFLANHTKAAIGFYQDVETGAGKAFWDYATKVDFLPLAVTKAEDVMSKYSAAEGQVHLFTPEGSTATTPDFGKEGADEAFGQWLFGHATPPLVKFSAESPTDFEGPIRVHALLFVDAEAEDYAKVTGAVKEAVTEFRTQMLSVEVAKNDSNILEAFGLVENDKPKLVIADMRADPIRKYILEEGLTSAETVGDFFSDVFAGRTKLHLKSEEPEPEDMVGPVKVIKGKSFKKEVLDSPKDVLLEFYAPWCEHCQALEPKYQALAKKLEDVDGMVIAKMDYTANEVDEPGINIEGVPTILFFPNGKKDAPVVYKGSREVEDLIDFLVKHATKSFDVEKEVAATKDEQNGGDVKDEL